MDAVDDADRPVLVVPRIMAPDEWEMVALASQARLVADAQSDLDYAAEALRKPK